MNVLLTKLQNFEPEPESKSEPEPEPKLEPEPEPKLETEPKRYQNRNVTGTEINTSVVNNRHIIFKLNSYT
jgi:hypothetical protein